MATSIRMATPEDAAALLSIYTPLVRETAITFELEPPTVDAFRHRIRDTLARRPWLVCEHHGDLIGYAYAASHRARAAYRWSVETSTYVSAAYRRRGVARALQYDYSAAMQPPRTPQELEGERPWKAAMHTGIQDLKVFDGDD